MRELREQSLRQIQNWEHIAKEYEEKRRQQQETDAANAAAKGGRPGTTNARPHVSANSYMSRY